MAFTLVRSFTPAGWEALEEFSLGHMPQRIDILLLQRTDAPPGPVRGLDSIMSRLNRFVIIEVKSPTDRLEAQDLPLLLGYAYQLIVVKGVVRRDEVSLITLSDGISESFRGCLEVYGARLAAREPGVWQHEGLELPGYSIDTGPASALPGNHLLYLFTKRFQREPGVMAGMLDGDEQDIFIHLYQRMVQLEGSDAGSRMKGYAMMKKELEDSLRQVLSRLPLEKRLEGLTAKEVLQRFTPEEVLEQIPPEQRLKGLDPEQRLKGLDPEELVQAMDAATLERLKQLLQ